MSLRKLYDQFRSVTELPIEISEIREAIQKFGIQDEITFIGRPLDPRELNGVFYQYKDRAAPYAEAMLKTLIIFPGNAPIDAQRLICGKEAVHLMDTAIERVDTSEKLKMLVEKLLGPLSTEDFGLADFIASQDKMAIYRCIPLLFPNAARDIALDLLRQEKVSLAQVVEWACLPPKVVKFVLDDKWPEVEKEFLENC
jgi:hypothetical protein